MYTYKIGYNTMEESSFMEYKHEQQFTHDQLMDIIEEALCSTYNADTHFRGNIAEIMDDPDFDKHLLSKGFIHLTYENNVTLFGWNNIDADDGIWDGPTPDKEKDMIIRIKNKIKSDATKNT